MPIVPTSALIAFVLGAWLLQQQATLPPLPVLAGIVLASLVGTAISHRIAKTRISVALLLAATIAMGLSWASWRAHERLSDALPKAWEARDVQVVGTVARLPDRHSHGQRFAFEVETVETPGAYVPRHLGLSWYSGYGNRDFSRPEPARVRAGERWRLTVRLRRPHGNANPHGFDYEAWLLGEGVRATGYVRQGGPDGQGRAQRLSSFVPTFGHLVERIRAALRERIEGALPNSPYAGVIVALVIGDQRAIEASDWQIFSRTGISHLVSISGLHVTMLASLAAAMAFALWRAIARRRAASHGGLAKVMSAQRVAALAGATIALAYCLLAGMGVPAQRTLIMLTIVAAALWMGRLTSASRVLAVACFVVVAIDPWAVQAAGFWLSFGAVAVIFYASAGRVPERVRFVSVSVSASITNSASAMEPENRPPRLAKLRAGASAAVRMQWAVTLGLVPFTMLLFQQVSLVSPFANALAIPLVSFVVTPLALFGAIVPGMAGDSVLWLAHALVEALAVVLTWMSALSWAVWPVPVAPTWAAAMALVGVMWAMAPRGVPLRGLGAVALLPALIWPSERPDPGHLRLTVLDVGQGSAVLIETRQRRYLYDTGPYYSPEADAGSRVILPYLRARGIGALDGMILSHNDNDHSGGALAILAALPVTWMASSLAPDSLIVQRATQVTRQSLRCEAGQTWSVDGFRFEFLHPDKAGYDQSRLKPNARSCVLRIAAIDRGNVPVVLLSGDVERSQEAEMLLRLPPATLKADVLLVPHHGSMTSSSEGFLDAVQPRLALVQAGYLNRFGHPRPLVLERYAQRGIDLARTDRDGALSLVLGASTLEYKSWRHGNARYWYGR